MSAHETFSAVHSLVMRVLPLLLTAALAAALATPVRAAADTPAATVLTQFQGDTAEVAACPDGHIPAAGFADLDSGNAHSHAIDCVVSWAIAQGVTATEYRPAAPVTRAQMASFIARLLEQAIDLPAGPKDHFSDDDGNPHELNINRLAELGIVQGTGPGRYSPGQLVTRAQMTSFLVRAFEHVTDQPLPASADYFGDDDGNPHEPNINKAAEAGFALGTAPGRFDPHLSVRRDQMASFIARTLERLFADGSVVPPVPEEVADPSAPEAPSTVDFEDGSGGVVGEPETDQVPAPPPEGPEEAVPFAINVAEHFDVEVADLPPPQAVTEPPSGAELPVSLPGPGPLRDAMPLLPASDDQVQAAIVHPQPNFRVWQWGQATSHNMPAVVGRLYGSYDGVRWFGQCTGTVVGANQVLTAAHCFWDFFGRPIPYFRFYPSLFGNQAPFGYWQSTVAHAWVDPHWVEIRNAYWADYGILRMGRNAHGQRIGDVVGGATVWMNGDRFPGNRYTIGYPSEGMYDPANAWWSRHAQCSDASCRPYFCWSPPAQNFAWEASGTFSSLGFGCYGAGGWSGGPVFQYSNGRLHLISVVSTGHNNVPYLCPLPRCVWHGNNSWGPAFRLQRFIQVWNAAQ